MSNFASNFLREVRNVSKLTTKRRYGDYETQSEIATKTINYVQPDSWKLYRIKTKILNKLG